MFEDDDETAPRGPVGVARRLLESSEALSGRLSYERRDGQLAMMDAVERALREDRHLFVEAGTGTGKTLAYLLPALLSGKKVVVSTATIALQEQIFSKDLPMAAAIAEAEGIPVRFALMKGLSNYVCKRRLAEALGMSQAPMLLRLAEWERGSESGDRAEAAFLPEDDPTFAQIASSTETRIGVECKYYDACHVTRMRREAERANLVVVSHHLFLADLALRSGPRGDFASALPAYDAVIFDEAQRLEAVATDFFGVRVTSARVDALLRDAEGTLSARATKSPELLKDVEETHRTVEQARVASTAFFSRLASLVSTGTERRPLAEGDVSSDLVDAAARLDLAVSLVGGLGTGPRSDEATELVARRAEDLRADLREVLLGSSRARYGGSREHAPDRVAWVESRERSVAVGASPIELGQILRGALFDRISTVVCTSATLSTAHPDGSIGFEFARARLGAPADTLELRVDSPFDYERNAAFFVPSDLPEPKDPSFEERSTQVIVALVEASRGGAFVLCTSVRMMRSYARSLRDRVAYPVMVQGEAPKKLLLARFRASREAVLVATSSFWEGVDVPGEALRLVVLDKIPFAVPTDPVVVARSRRIEAEGGNAFVEYSVPQAAMTLKQGFGRLIRTEQDRGVVALLDARARNKGYGPRLLAGLPRARACATVDDVRAFFAESLDDDQA